MTRLKALIPELPQRAWVVLSGDAFSAIGHGLVLPFLIVYLHRVRDFELETAALMISGSALVGVIGAPFAGALVDRIGPRRALIGSLALSACASLSLAFVTEVWHGFVATGLLGLGPAAFWPSIQSLLSTVVEPHQRSSVFSVHYMMLNAGIGLGGITGGLIADISSTFSFQLLYFFDAVTYLPFIALLLWMLRGVGGRLERARTDEGTAKVGYLAVLKDRVFLRVWALMAMLVTIGYSQLESGFPAYATGDGGIGTRALGLAFAANTAVIVVSQLLVLKRLEGHRRTRSIGLMTLLWGSAWGVAVISGAVLDELVGAAGFVLTAMLFALGETMMSPTIPAIVNDLAPEQLRGRYNAVHSLAWSAGHIVGPAMAGFLLGRALGEEFFIGLVVACVGVGAYALRLERYLPAAANVVSTTEARPEPDAVPQAV